MTRRTLGLAAFLALATALALAGGWLLLTSFKTYDDEGYVLLSLANFARGGRLYSEVYTQYGPFFYAWNDALRSALGFEFNHLAGRGLTLAYWLGTALACAAIVDARTRSLRWAALALVATFAHLWQMTAEPGHPGGLIAFLVALGAWAGTACLARERYRTLAAVIGLIGAALALTKINVGLFFFAGAGAWWLLHLRPAPLHRAGPWLAALALAALPWVLMHALLAQPWVATFAAISTAGLLGTLLAAQPGRRALVDGGKLLWLAVAALGVTALVTGLVLHRGGTPGDLVEGVIRGPLRHPGVFFFAVQWRPGALVCAAVSLALGGVAWRRGWGERPGFRHTLAGIRLALLVVAVVAWFGGLPVSALGLTINYGLSLVPWLVLPLAAGAEARAQSRLRVWLGLLFLTQALHAYPVGGSQLGWGTFLFAPLLVLAAAEAAAVLGARGTSLAASLGALAALGLAGVLLQTGWQRWRTSAPLRLPGAESLRLPELLSARLRALVLNAGVHGDLLFSLPGLYSFNLWSARPTPTLANATHWFSLLDPARQQAIAEKLAADPRALVVVERSLLGFMRAAGLPVAGPLHTALQRDFVPIFASGNYELWARRGRPLAPLATARLYAARDLAGARFQLQLCVYTPTNARLARVEWIDCTDEAAPRIARVLDAANARLELTPLAPAGASLGPAAAATFPTTLPHFATVTLFSDENLAPLPRARGLLRLRDESGALLAEAVFAD